MPVSAAVKVEALSADFGSQRRLADALGVSPAQVSRWTRGQGSIPANAERLDLLEVAMSPAAAVRARDGGAVALRGQSAAQEPPPHRPDQAGEDRGARSPRCARSGPARTRDPVPLLPLGRRAAASRARRGALVPARAPGRRPARRAGALRLRLRLGAAGFGGGRAAGALRRHRPGHRRPAPWRAARSRSRSCASPRTRCSSTSTRRSCWRRRGCARRSWRLRRGSARRPTRWRCTTATRDAAGIRWPSAFEAQWANVHALRPRPARRSRSCACARCGLDDPVVGEAAAFLGRPWHDAWA